MNNDFIYNEIMSGVTNLTVVQKTEIAAIQLVAESQVKSIANMQHQLRLELLKLMKTSVFSESKAGKISSKLIRLENEKIKSKRLARDKMLTVLTPQQLKCFKSLPGKKFHHAFVAQRTGMPSAV